MAIATLVPIAALGWLAFRLIRQDREMEGQRRRERLEFAAGRVALAAETAFPPSRSNSRKAAASA